ncbi:MAG: glucosidase [Deltaproteobacteria bacterium]|nr:glucosidase [Deltaproteobacteria bacterium]
MAVVDTELAEQRRLDEDARRERNWRRWGPYLSERQWGTVREDYSAWGACWEHFPHDHARSRVYRWGEDGLLGICDRGCRVCVAVALWNGRDPILKERLFGLAAHEGNHCEDVKELYYFLDATPTSSYLKALYKYPQEAFPYAQLLDENRRRDHRAPELELEDLGVFERGYWDVLVEYAKAGPDDVLVRYTVTNRGPAEATLHVLPSVWLRNTWSWNRTGEGYDARGEIAEVAPGVARVVQPALGELYFACEDASEFLFAHNEHNAERLWGAASITPYPKDAFHRRVVGGDAAAVDPARRGTKCAAWCRVDVPAGASRVVRARLSAAPGFADFEDVFAARIAEADAYHRATRPAPLTDEERAVVRQADAGLVWSRKFYHYIVEHWFEGDPGHPAPPASRGRNRGWEQLWARDVISMPDPWEYPWFAAWDLAFHCVAMAPTDPAFAKQQLLLLCREWYMHPNGQLPAYEFGFADVNPPVHAWAVWRTYQLSGASSGRDREFLERAFDKCVVNFTWWVNRQDAEGHNLFTGGFLGLDNVGVFDRGQPLPGGGKLVQADATGWMAFYCTTMLEMALELAREEAHYGDLALKFFEHFVAIARAANEAGGTGLWNDGDGFYEDQMHRPGRAPELLPIRSIVGLVPLFAVASLDEDRLAALPQFRARLEWVFANRPKLTSAITTAGGRRLLAIPSRAQLERVLARALDERELLSPHGIRSLSRAHGEHPYALELDGRRFEVHYAPGESDTTTFGGNSNWRGPIWFPVNYLMVEALDRFHAFYGDGFTVECPTGSGVRMHLGQVARELERRLVSLFLPGAAGHRPCHGGAARYAEDPAFRELVLFHEYFHGDTGRGLGASHQTGWTALAANLLERVARSR